jgi:hypothetical protein
MMMMRTLLGLLTLSALRITALASCATDRSAEPENVISPSTAAVATERATALVRNATEVTGLEGFFAFDQLTDAWLDEHQVAVDRAVLERVRARTVKLVLDSGEQRIPEPMANKWEALACGEETAAAWNADRCQGLKARKCEAGVCTLHLFGNCSGLLLGEGRLLTAAHCVADLKGDAQRRSRSSVLVQTSDATPQKKPLGEVLALLKQDFAHHWVAVDETSPVDVAVVAVDDGGLPPFPVAAVPDVGGRLFIHGYPRVEGRSDEALAAHGYTRRAGEPSFSFGRVAHAGAEELVFCNPDGDQEHWRLAEDCPVGDASVGGERTWRGPITELAILGTYDALNGYSGAPVFDAQGRLVAINSTIMSPFNPQEQYGTEMFTVAIAAEPALERLHQAMAK